MLLVSSYPLRVLLWVLKEKTSLVTQMAIYTLLTLSVLSLSFCISATFCGGKTENRKACSWS